MRSVRLSTSWLVGVVAVVAFALRWWGANAGLPYMYHPDEPRYVTIAQTIIKTGDLNPHFFNYPSLFVYLHAAAYVPLYAVGRLAGNLRSFADIAAPHMLTMGTAYTAQPSTVLLGRGVSVALGTAGVVLVYVVGRQVYNRAVALFAALLLALGASHIEHSRFVTPDVLLVCCIMLALWAYMGVWQHGNTRNYVFAGIATGLVAGSKYNGAMIVLVLVLAHQLRRNGRGLRDWRIYAALALSSAVFLVTTPFALLDWRAFVTDLRFESQHYATGHAGMEGDALRWYVRHLWRVGGLASVLAVVELGRGVWRRDRTTLLLGAFPITYFIFISSFVVRNDRTALPLIPFVCLLAAANVHWLLSASRRVLPHIPPQLIGTVLAACVLVLPVAQTLRTASPKDTVAIDAAARAWMVQHMPTGTSVVIESYAPYLDPEQFAVQGIARIIDHPPQWYVDTGVEYVVLSRNMYGRYYNDPQRYAADVAGYDAVFAQFELIQSFIAAQHEIRIYRVPRASVTPTTSRNNKEMDQIRNERKAS